MSILLADIDATCSGLGNYDGNQYYSADDALQSLKHLIWILRRDNLDSHEYRRYIGHKKVIQTDLLPMLVSYCDDAELADVLLRLLVNLTNPTLLFFREDLPKDGAGRRTYLDLVEITQSYKEIFSTSSSVWLTLAERLQKIMNIEVGDRGEEENLVLERILVLTRNVLQVPTNPQSEKRVDNDISIHDQVLWALHESGMFDLILYILSSEYENQYQLHALEIVNLIFREQKVETLADASVQRTVAEKQADEAALIAARRSEKQKAQIRLPPARHSRFGGTYVFRNMKSVSDRDLICHQSLERVVQKDFSHDKKNVKQNFRLARDDDKYERQSAFCIRIVLREFCIEILTSAFNNMTKQVRRVLDRNHGLGESGGHDQSYLLWAMRFFLEFNRLNGFKLHLVTEALSPGSVHWICNQIQHDTEMIQTDKKKKIKWNRRLQLGIQAYREFLFNLQLMELQEDEDTQALLGKLKSNMFYVVEYREIVLHLLLNYNENNFTRNYLRDLIDTNNVYLKMMEKFCQGSIVVQTKVKSKPKSRKKVTKPKKLSDDELLEKLANDWDARIAANLSVVLANDINIPEEDHPVPFDAASERPIDEQRGDCMTRLHKFLRDEDFERAVLLMRAGRACWTDTECFGGTNAQPEDELMLMKEIYLTDLAMDDKQDDGNDFWNDLDQFASGSGDEDDEESTATKEIVLNFADFEKRLLNPKVVRACTWCLQTWEKMNYREIKSAVTLLHRIAVNLNMPAMLMQAQLFRVFQQVFNAPRDGRYEELRRLGAYVVRQFLKIAQTNPKAYAELLFFKSHRECNEMANGYCESYEGVEANQKAWSEAQEEELTRLYMENQASPQTDQDVIDWMLENLIEKSRTRRGVIKKLKELGLIFKAPTKRSNALAVNKNVFVTEEDEKLRELYDEHRLETNCLQKIMEVFNKKRSKKAVVKRMVQLGLVADESEILPVKKPKNHQMGEKRRESSSESNDSSSDNDRPAARPQNRANKTFALNNRSTQGLRTELEESLKEAIEWVVESLKEAAEDFEEPSDDPDDAIPIVPFTESQKAAMENDQFKKLLESVNLQAPLGSESYWKIPANMVPADINLRAKLLAGEDVAEEQPAMNANDSDEDEDLFERLRAQRETLMYNHSDAGNERSAPLAKTNNKVEKVGKPNTKIVQHLLRQVTAKHSEGVEWIKSVLRDKATNKSSDAVDEMLLVPSIEVHKAALDDEKFKKLLVTINLTPPDGIESLWRIPKGLSAKEILHRVDLLVAPEDSSDDEEQEIVIKRKKKQQPNSDELAINTQELKQRLADLDSSSDDDQSDLQQVTRKNVLASSDDENVVKSSEKRKSVKRDRSEISGDTPDENEMNATNNHHKRIRRIADSSDDE